MSLLLGYFENGFTHTCIGLLNVEQLADCRSNVGDVNFARGGSVLYFPAVEQQWDMGIVRIPYVMGGACR